MQVMQAVMKPFAIKLYEKMGRFEQKRRKSMIILVEFKRSDPWWAVGLGGFKVFGPAADDWRRVAELREGELNSA